VGADDVARTVETGAIRRAREQVVTEGVEGGALAIRARSIGTVQNDQRVPDVEPGSGGAVEQPAPLRPGVITRHGDRVRPHASRVGALEDPTTLGRRLVAGERRVVDREVAAMIPRVKPPIKPTP
jgi:hypothetical protein